MKKPPTPSDPKKIRGKLHRGFAEALRSDWRTAAREEQLPPDGDWTHWVFCGGRGSGKTRSGAEWVLERVAARIAKRIHLVAPTVADTRDVMLEGDSGLLTVAPKHLRPTYVPSKRRLDFTTGAQALLFSADEPDRLRGPQCDTAWIDELCAMRTAQEVLDNLNFGLRRGKDPRCLVTTTPRPIKVFRELLKAPDTVVTRGSSYRNKANLAPSFLAQVLKKYEGTRLGRQEIYGEVLDDVPGALWSQSLIEETRVARAPTPFERVVVAVDPAVTFGPDSNETGIIVVGLGPDGAGYVIDDLSGRIPPEEWARKVIIAYRRHRADRIVAEINNGGQLVETTLRSVDPSIPFKAVHASRGKLTRAEPVSALYEQKRVHHVGVFGPLEDQLTSYDGTRDGASPDRLDALVWAVFELMLGEPAGGFIREASLLTAPPPTPAVATPIRAPVEVPAIIDGLYCYAAAGLGAEPDAIGVVYFGACVHSAAAAPLLILDWDLEQIEAGTLGRWVPATLKRLDELARATRSRTGVGGIVLEPEGLGGVIVEQAQARGYAPLVSPITDEKILRTPIPARAIAAGGHANAGLVLLARTAHEKFTAHKGALRNHFIHQVVGFGVGQDPNAAGVLLVAFANGVMESFASNVMRSAIR